MRFVYPARALAAVEAVAVQDTNSDPSITQATLATGKAQWVRFPRGYYKTCFIKPAIWIDNVHHRDDT